MYQIKTSEMWSHRVEQDGEPVKILGPNMHGMKVGYIYVYTCTCTCRMMELSENISSFLFACGQPPQKLSRSRQIILCGGPLYNYLQLPGKKF